VGEAVVSGGDAAEVLEAAEHAFDGVAVAVEIGREAALPAAVGLGRDIGGGALVFDPAAHRVAVIALVGVHDLGAGEAVEQGLGGEAIGHLAAGQRERDRPAQAVGEGVDFGGAPAARAANGLAALPPFPPAAQR
jgi:hypothetical protein